jgi:hypothetical protein
MSILAAVWLGFRLSLDPSMDHCDLSRQHLAGRIASRY